MSVTYWSNIISIHALREEGDHPAPHGKQAAPQFLSTPSARRATTSSRQRSGFWQNFYPRPPRGGRPLLIAFANLCRNFYPRPPRGGRRFYHTSVPSGKRFLSTPSARRATPRVFHRTAASKFLSTPSARRATRCSVQGFDRRMISIHALREEGDTVVVRAIGARNDFYPRPPRGGRLTPSSPALPPTHFYPRPPRGGRRCRIRI